MWTADITFIWALQGWLYLAVVANLFSYHLIGWNLDKQMTQLLAIQALVMAIDLRNSSDGLIHHSGRGSQYANQASAAA